MRKRTAVVFPVALLAVIGVGTLGWLYVRLSNDGDAAVTAESGTQSYRTTALTIGGQMFDLDIADTAAKKRLGLGGRTSLAANHGMVFVYGRPGEQCFWMKDMHFSIDILWLDADKKVGHIEKSLSPDTYPQTYCPDVSTQYVLELPAGAADKLALKVGDILPLEL